MGLLDNIALGYINRQKETEEQKRKERLERNKGLLTGARSFLEGNLEGLRPEAQPRAMQALFNLNTLDPASEDDKKLSKRLKDEMSFLWEGLEEPKAQPQRMEATIPAPGREPMSFAAEIPAPRPPEGYRRPAHFTQRELENKAYAERQVKNQELIDQEYGKTAARRRAEIAFPEPPTSDRSINEYELALMATNGDPVKAMELVNSQKTTEKNQAYRDVDKNGRTIRQYFDPTKPATVTFESDIGPAGGGGEPLYPVIQNGQVVYIPRSQAAGLPAPRTIYSPEGMPSTAGQAGVSMIPPPAIDATTQQSLSGWKVAIDSIDKEVLPAIKKLQSSFGPAIGRLKTLQVEQLGGYGATAEEKKLALDLRRLLMSQAFAEGGKQLTGTEKEEFTATLPALKDTVEQAIIKAEGARNYLAKKYQERVAVMPVNQRRQLGGTPTAPAIPSPTGGGASVPAGDFKDGDTFQMDNGLNLIRRGGKWVPQ